MLISEFIANYKNHPVFFIGSGLSQRYLENSYSWEGLLQKIALEIYENNEKFTDLKFKNKNTNDDIDFAKLATDLEKDFNSVVEQDRNGKFKIINDIFYNQIQTSRLKIYIAELVKELNYSNTYHSELNLLKQAGKNIASIITTNYDCLVENIFGFNPLISNDILLSNPYGAIYKIHGCCTNPDSIVITHNDYDNFVKNYELIQAQLISIFIHNPIVFLGYSISDKNIKDILETIFRYINPNSEQAKQLKSNFLLVEYQKYSNNQKVENYNIQLNNGTFISINKIATDDYMQIYKSIANLKLPISAMDIKKVENIVREIQHSGVNSPIKVHIVEDIESLKNSDKILAIGSEKTLSIEVKNKKDFLRLYFRVIDEKSYLLVKCINAYTISSSEWFPVFGFCKLLEDENIEQDFYEKMLTLKKQQEDKIEELKKELKKNQGKYKVFNSPQELFDSKDILISMRHRNLQWLILENHIDLEIIKDYLLQNKSFLDQTDFRKILCLYDFKAFF